MSRVLCIQCLCQILMQRIGKIIVLVNLICLASVGLYCCRHALFGCLSMLGVGRLIALILWFGLITVMRQE